MAELIRKDDSLNDGRVKLNEAITDANTAKVTSKGAEVTAGQAMVIAQTAENKSDSTQTQLDTIVIDGDSSVEAAQARVDANGVVYTTLKKRLDTEIGDVTKSVGTSVESFGAVGNNIADDTTAIEMALRSGFPIIGDPSKQYKITRTISVPTCNIVGNLQLVPSGPFMALDVGEGISVSNTKLIANVTPRATKITVENASGIAEGQLLKMVSTALWYYDNRGSLTKGELHLVKSVVGNVIELSEPIWDQYTVASETVTIQTYNPQTCYIDGLHIKYPTLTATSGMRIRTLISPVISNLKIEKATTLGLSISQCYGATISSPSLIECFQITSGTGYGIQDSASFGTVIDSGYFYRNRRAVDFSGGYPSRGWIVSNSRAIAWGQDYGDGFGTHGTAEFGTFIGNQTFGGRYGFMIRGGNITLANNKIWGADTTAIAHADGDGIEITNNSYHGAIDGRTHNPTAGIGYFYSKTFTTKGDRALNVIQGNTAHGVRTGFISLNGGDERNFVVKDNTALGWSNSSSSDVTFCLATTPLNLSRSIFKNNSFIVRNGVRKYFSDTVNVAETVECEELDLRKAVLTAWSGTGTLENVVLDLSMSRLNGRLNIFGTIKFDVIGGAARVALDTIPTPNPVLYGNMLRVDTLKNVVCTTLSQVQAAASRLYISSDDLTYNKEFPIGTNYRLNVDLSYRVPK